MAEKGLKSNVVGLFGGTMLGISSMAPAYALTATLGILAAAVGAQTPVVIIAGFLPMFFAAYAYRGGVGLVLILCLGLILAGLVIMAILRVRHPAFFRGETVIHESVDEHMAKPSRGVMMILLRQGDHHAMRAQPFDKLRTPPIEARHERPLTSSGRIRASRAAS